MAFLTFTTGESHTDMNFDSDLQERYERLVENCPDLPILFVSGYSSDDLRRELGIGSKRFLLQKPFTAQALMQKVARALSRNAPI